MRALARSLLFLLLVALLGSPIRIGAQSPGQAGNGAGGMPVIRLARNPDPAPGFSVADQVCSPDCLLRFAFYLRVGKPNG